MKPVIFGRINLGQLAQQNAQRKSVADNVMNGQHQDMMLFFQADQPRAQQRSANQVKRQLRFLELQHVQA